MSSNIQWDSFTLSPLDIPYNRINAELDDSPRFVRGQNTFVTTGGKVSRRLGTLALNAESGLDGLRVDRMWSVETLDTPPLVYIVVSAFNPLTGFWEIWYQRQQTTPVPWVQVTSYRDVNLSTLAHEAVVSRGLLYIKGIPDAGSSEKLGTVIFDGTAGSVTIKPWGLLGPTVSAALRNSAIGTITTVGGINATDSSVDVDITDGTLPAAPFVIQCDFEQISVGASTGTTGAVTLSSLTRAFNGTVAAAHNQTAIVIERNWTASAHLVTVNQYWEYSYAWKTITGQYSNRAPATQNPDALPSRTGPFFNQQPQITVQGTADTTNVPSIGIFRTTDGGGTFFFLEDITNTGAGNISYTDNSFTSNAGDMDPIPDESINVATVAPSLTDHSPPPTVLAPKVVGVNAPAQSTPIAWYQGRLWYGIGNVLFFSGEEEILLGVPEESFPSGLFGNFFRFQFPITNLAATPNNLYVFTSKATYVITGTNLATFSAQVILDNYGFPFGMNRAIDSFQDSVVFMTHDYRIAIISDGNQSQPTVLSDPLFTDIVDNINAGGQFDIKYFADLDKELIFVTGHNPTDPTRSRQFVFDIKKSVKLARTGSPNFWNLPWTYPSTCQLSARGSESTTQRRMIFASWNGTDASVFARIDPTYQTAQDYTTDGTVNFNIDLVFCLTEVPAGDHVNQRRVPRVTPVLYSVSFERTAFSGDDDPSFYYFKDDLWTDPISINLSEDPPRRAPSKGYKTMEFPIFEALQRVAWELTKIDSGDRFELQSFILTFAPDEGA